MPYENPFTPPTLTGFNAQPPSDDGQRTATNAVRWSTHLDKIGNPLRAYCQALAASVLDAFNSLVTALDGELSPKFKITAAETSAGVTPTAYQYQPGHAFRYGCVGDGVTDDTAALVRWAASGKDLFLPEGNFLTTGVAISSEIRTISGIGENSKIVVDDTSAGSFGLKFIHPSGNTAHFVARALLRDFQIVSVGGAEKSYGLWLDNAEIRDAIGLIVDMSANTYDGVERDSTFGVYGRYQQDGTWIRCSFTGGSGAYADGLYLASIDAASLPNSNIFISCRAQSCGGWGVRQERGVGNMWIGGKLQANKLGGWIEADDGAGNGGLGTCLYGVGFEHNGDGAGSGHDLRLEISDFMSVRDCSFQTPLIGNSHAIYADYAIRSVFDHNQCYSANLVEFVSGSKNKWYESNSGFGAITGTAYLADPSGGYVELTYGTAVDTDLSGGKFFVIAATDTSAFTINNPSGDLVQGREIVYEIANLSGGSMGTITWGNQFKLESFSNPANSTRKTIRFVRTDAHWVQSGTASGDLPL